MSAFSNAARWVCLAGFCLALWGCGERSPSPPIANPAPAEASKPAAVAEAVPEETPPGMKEALEQARTWWEDYLPVMHLGDRARMNKIETDRGMSKAFTGVKLGIADIPVFSGKTVPNWTKVRLNAAGVGCDAIRFTNAYNFPADLVWAFVVPAETQFNWGILPEGGHASEGWGFKSFYRKNNLELAGLDLPARNTVIFQHLGEGKVFVGCEFFLWFVFEDTNPIDVYVKLKLLDPRREQSAHFASAHGIAERLGVEQPFRFSEAASLIDLASDEAELRGPEAGLEFLEQRLAKTSDRAAEFYQAQLAHNYAGQLVAKPETREKANPYFLKAAAAMRQLQKKYGPLEPEEQSVLALTLYNEACTLAITGQAEKGLQSLREAVQAGFKDLAQIRGDDDLQSVRELPAFKELQKQLQPDTPESPFK